MLILLQVIHDAEAHLEIIKITVEVEREKLQQARFTLREQQAKHMGRSTSSGTAHTLKLTFWKYPSIHTNYIISHSTILQYNHNILYGSYAEKKY